LGEKLSSMLYKGTAYNLYGNMGTRSPVIAYHTTELAGFKVGVVELLVSQNIIMIKPMCRAVTILYFAILIYCTQSIAIY